MAPAAVSDVPQKTALPPCGRMARHLCGLRGSRSCPGRDSAPHGRGLCGQGDQGGPERAVQVETEGRSGYGAKHQHGYGQGKGHGGPFHRGQPGAAEQRATAGACPAR